jgi:hypothetical protein
LRIPLCGQHLSPLESDVNKRPRPAGTLGRLKPLKCEGQIGGRQVKDNTTTESAGLPPESRWKPPMPYNRPAALDSMGTIAAPLLASVSIALIALVLTSTASYRWPNVVLLLLAVSAAGFVASVEFAFMARQYAITPDELEGWWPDHDQPERRAMLRQEQRFHVERFENWADRARWAYSTAILALSLGVTSLLLPPETTSLKHVPTSRVLVLAVALATFIAEFVWLVAGVFRDRRQRIHLPEVGPEA